MRWGWDGCTSVAHLYGPRAVHLFRTCQQSSNPPAQGRCFRTAVILCYSPEEAKPALDGDVKVPLECPEEQMVSSIYTEKGDLNQREEVLTRQVRYTVHPRKKSNQMLKVKNQTPPPRGPLTWVRAVTWGLLLLLWLHQCKPVLVSAGVPLLYSGLKNATG